MHPAHARLAGLRRLAVMALPALALALGGCAVVGEFQPSVAVRAMAPDEYVALRRGDVLGTGQLSALTVQTLRVTGLDAGACAVSTAPACMQALAAAREVDDETRWSALAELWLQRAVSIASRLSGGDAAATSAWIETARHAYAYLFFTRRTPGERAFEERQTQVRDWYNYAVQKTVMRLFGARRDAPHAKGSETAVRLGGWTLRIDLQARLPNGAAMPRELLPANALAFQGLRGVYRRDGLGAEFVAVTEAAPGSGRSSADGAPPPDAWSEMPTPNVTAVLRFDVRTVDELLATHTLVVGMHDPLMQAHLLLHGEQVPLAGDFTAGYGLWLARSGFSRQSLRGLLGRGDGIEQPHLYLMQPFDPGRRIVVMLHGLASSPEAWVNVANELLADARLRGAFQIWQVYYPTNMPMPANHAAIRRVLSAALRHFDPGGAAPASHGLVLIGHSMGGVMARLMVSTADRQLWDWAASDPRIDLDRLVGDRARLEPLLRFEPFPGVERAIFIATPHRGTVVAGEGLGRWLASLIRLPLTLLASLGETFPVHAETGDAAQGALLERVPNSVDQLDENDPFVQAAGTLPISRQVVYHSIIARRHAEGPLADSDDGLVPYRSAHLEGAASEKIIVSGHSVQESAAAILEIRRILHEDIGQYRPPAASRAAGSGLVPPAGVWLQSVNSLPTASSGTRLCVPSQ